MQQQKGLIRYTFFVAQSSLSAFLSTGGSSSRWQGHVLSRGALRRCQLRVICAMMSWPTRRRRTGLAQRQFTEIGWVRRRTVQPICHSTQNWPIPRTLRVYSSDRKAIQSPYFLPRNASTVALAMCFRFKGNGNICVLPIRRHSTQNFPRKRSVRGWWDRRERNKRGIAPADEPRPTAVWESVHNAILLSSVDNDAPC